MHRRVWLVVAVTAGLLLLAGLLAIMLALADEGLGFLDGDEGALGSYLAIFLLIAGDAVVPILPGETALNAASVLASQGTLDLALVILAGALGAVVGDNALYWLARGGLGGARLETLQDNERVRWVMRLLGKRGPLLIVFGRYIPGVRFFVNASMGALRMPYHRFLLWSTVGGTLWATYTSLLAYTVGTTLAEFPLASIIISGLVTTILIAAIYWLDLRRDGSEDATDDTAGSTAADDGEGSSVAPPS